MLKSVLHLSALTCAAILTLCPLAASAAPTSAATELAVKVVKAEGTEDQTRAGLEKILPLLMTMFKSQEAFKNYSDADMQKLADLLGAELNNAIPELTQKHAAFYAQKMTETQLNSLVAFYASPEGKTYAATRVAAATELQGEFEVVGQKVALTAMQKFLEWKSKQPK